MICKVVVSLVKLYFLLFGCKARQVIAKLVGENCSSADSPSDNESCEILNEFDVPGAALNGREASTLTIPELKRWLQCRMAPTAGKKADLVARLTPLTCVKTFNR